MFLDKIWSRRPVLECRKRTSFVKIDKVELWEVETGQRLNSGGHKRDQCCSTSNGAELNFFIFFHSMLHSSTTALQCISMHFGISKSATVHFPFQVYVRCSSGCSETARGPFWHVCHMYFSYVFHVCICVFMFIDTEGNDNILRYINPDFELLISAFCQLTWPCGRIRLQTFSSRFVTGTLQRTRKSGEITYCQPLCNSLEHP